MKGTWMDAVGLPGLGADLLDGMTVKGAAAFETWLLAQQRHAAAASEAVLHEAALGSMARGALEAAIGYAVRAAAMSPLDENHQALLIRLYRMPATTTPRRSSSPRARRRCGPSSAWPPVPPFRRRCASPEDTR